MHLKATPGKAGKFALDLARGLLSTMRAIDSGVLERAARDESNSPGKFPKQWRDMNP